MAGSALIAHQQAINVAGNNIANVNTPGYSRQRLVLTSGEPQYSSIGPIGNGLKAVKVERVYDRFIGHQMSQENQALGRWTAEKQVLQGVEIIFDESGAFGFNQALDEYFNAWQDLSMKPTGMNERQVLISRGETLAVSLNQKYANLQSAQVSIDTDIRGAVDTINQLSAQIADLNKKIVETETSKYTANEYRDQRDLALKQLSELIDINSFEDGLGAAKVTLNGGRSLIDGQEYHPLSTRIDATSGLVEVHWVQDDTTSVDISNNIAGGKIYGWLETRDQTIQDYMDRLDELAAEIIQEVNDVHSVGYGLDGSTGNDFFTGTDASDIAVNTALVNDSNLIAAAADINSLPGDSSNAVIIANLQNKTVLNGDTATMGEFYNSLVSDVGNEVLQIGAYYNHQADMITQLENYRESISGVSLDEEMINLVKFQGAYDASAKLISTTDELIQTVLGMI
jgi:flagellar hook-associated protein 1 FlgK